MLSDTGIIGLLLYYMFLFCLIINCNKAQQLCPMSLEKRFIIGLKGTYLCIICFSFYDIRPNFHYFWFLYGLSLCLINIYSKKYLIERFKLGRINNTCKL